RVPGRARDEVRGAPAGTGAGERQGQKGGRDVRVETASHGSLPRTGPRAGMISAAKGCATIPPACQRRPSVLSSGKRTGPAPQVRGRLPEALHLATLPGAVCPHRG